MMIVNRRTAFSGQVRHFSGERRMIESKFVGEKKQFMSESKITRINPAASLPDGEIIIECENYDASQPRLSRVMIGGEQSRIVSASAKRIVAAVPEINRKGSARVTIEGRDRTASEAAMMYVGRKLAEDIHAVANPAFDPDEGALYVTRSGSRGQRLPITILRVDNDGAHAFSGEVVNPTGIAFDSHGTMFVTSRMDGNVYRVTEFNEAVAFARDLGTATGLAFDREGRMYVGDRTGTIHRVNAIGEVEEWASVEPSVSAYHLAFGLDGDLFMTGPTVSSFDAVTRIDRFGETKVFYRGLGRPQGLAFDREGNLYVAASLQGRRGIVRISPDGSDAELAVAGMNVVGLAFNRDGDMVIATNDTVYSLPLGIHGTLLN